MSTTTIRLPQDLKSRVAKAAERTGATTHSFILEAIAEKTALAEQRAEFDTTAEDRYAGIIASGKTITWEDMRTYLQENMAGKPAERPVAQKLTR